MQLGQWKEHTATCTGTRDAVKSNATKIDACKSAVVDAVKEVKTAVVAGHSTGKDTQAAVKVQIPTAFGLVGGYGM
ncbi:hypothetical protein F4780DRAFT_776702 [Xylariomycetidae sp. FL0641]|nr:hypothetical protein F4780DRAFT_776702 [Xylariomycetidae sp. FL0641]